MNDDPSLDREYRKGYHTGRAAAYETCSHQLVRFLERCHDEKRVPSPSELREIASQWEGYSITACASAEKGEEVPVAEA